MALRYFVGGHYLDIVNFTVYMAMRNVAKAINKHYGEQLVFPFEDKEA